MLIAIAAVTTLGPRIPRESQLRFALGPGHAEIVELRVAYVQGGEVLKGVRFDFPEGAPAEVAHRVSLPSGPCEVRAELLARDNRLQQVVRRWESPSEGHLRLQLAPP